MEFLTVLSVAAFFVCLARLLWQSLFMPGRNKNFLSNLIECMVKDEGYSFNNKYINLRGAIAIDETHKKIVVIKFSNIIKLTYETWVIPFEDLIDVEILENGNIVTYGIAGASFLGARTKRKITDLNLKITINNTTTPVIIYSFLTDVSEAFVAQGNIIHWHGLLKVLISRKNNKVSIDEEATKLIENLSDLKDKGVLTNEEFELKKRQILYKK